ncbi:MULTISPECIES: TIGR02270 family protein [unclassified Variovorax]|uniref:TIGR02270 family protein n=1 Tax=unclassified Variovorax TaxID=663243 RepID=UPI003F448AC3
MTASSAQPLASMVEEHADEAGFLWLQRSSAVHAPNYGPPQLADLDERLSAHIDGLRVAADAGWAQAQAMLDNEGAEDFFVAGVLAIEAVDGRFDALVARAKDLPEVVPGLISALGWVEPQHLGGRVKALLDDPSPLKRKLGVAACALHRRDPGPVLDELVVAAPDSVRIRALRAAGELGRIDLLPAAQAVLGEVKAELRFWAAWSAVLLGDRAQALETLAAFALQAGPRQPRAFQLALQAMDVAAGHELLLAAAGLPDAQRLRILGAGFIGDARYVPWLIEQMAQPAVARIAGEAFATITGADFNGEQMEIPPPDDFEDGPTDDPDDENVELPQDIALPWPDAPRIHSWWQANQPRFLQGTRSFMGAPVSADSCVGVLRSGFQRQRVAAALHLSLGVPQAPLFATGAPAWRQRRWLDKVA